MTNQPAVPEDIQTDGNVANAHEGFAKAFHDAGDPRQLRDLFNENGDGDSEDANENHGVCKMQEAFPSKYRQEDCQVTTGADGEVSEQDAQDGGVLVFSRSVVVIVTLQCEVDGQEAENAEEPFRQEARQHLAGEETQRQ